MPSAAITSKLKALVPPHIAAFLGNCGGANRRRARFAGNLLRHDLTEAEFLAIYHSLIFPNGVRKTTAPERNSMVMRRVLEAGYVGRKKIRVLEVGASAGLDALATWKLLRGAGCDVERYDLGDLFTEVRYDRRRGLVFDEDGRLLQVDLGSRFVAIYFSYNHPLQRITNLPKRLRPWALKRRLKYDPSAPVVRIPLVHPDLGVARGDTPFRLKRMNVFDPIDERYDLVVCMHLLVERYFDQATIDRAVDNLARSL